MPEGLGTFEATIRLRAEVDKAVNKVQQAIEKINRESEKGTKINFDTSKATKTLDNLYTQIDAVGRKYAKAMSFDYPLSGAEDAKKAMDSLIAKARDMKNVFGNGTEYKGNVNSAFVGRLQNDIKEAKTLMSGLMAEAKKTEAELKSKGERLVQQQMYVQRAEQNSLATQGNLAKALGLTKDDNVQRELTAKIQELIALRSDLNKRLAKSGGERGAFFTDKGDNIFASLYGRGGAFAEMDRYAKQVMRQSGLDDKAIQQQQKDVSALSAAYGGVLKKQNELLARGANSGKMKLDTSQVETAISNLISLQGRLGNALKEGVMPQGMMKEYAEAIKSADRAIADLGKQERRLASVQPTIQKNVKEIDKIISSIDEKRNMRGVSENTLADLEKWRRSLGMVRTQYQRIKGDADAIFNKGELVNAGNNKDRITAKANAAIEQAEREAKETIRLEREVARERQRLEKERVEAQRKHEENLAKIRSQAQERAALSQQRHIGFGMDEGTRLKMQEFYAAQEAEQKRLAAEEKKRLAEEARAQKKSEAAARANAKAHQELVSRFQQLNNELPRSVRFLRDMAQQFGLLGGAMGVQQLVMAVIKTGGEIEKQHIALQSIIGDLQNANALFGQIKGLALQSPFTFGELNRDVKQLAAYGVEYENLYDTTKRLADISSGLGVSFERIALAYGQVKSRSWLDAKELRQFAYAGVPLLQKLAEYYSKSQGEAVSTAKVRKMITNREVGFEDVRNVLWGMTDEGGKFYNMQLTLSETLLGRYNKLIDAWEIMLSEFASGDNIVGGVLKRILDGITAITLGLNKTVGIVATLFTMPALRGLGSLFKGGAGKNLLAVKSSLASEYTRRILAGEKLYDTERHILATKNEITKGDIRALMHAKAITREEAKRLLLLRSMNMAKAQGNRMEALGLGMRVFGQSALMGVKSAFSGILGFLGGWSGTAITLIAGTAMYWYEQSKKIEEATERTTKEIQDRYKTLTEFLERPLNLTTNEDVRRTLTEYKDMYRQIMGKEYSNPTANLNTLSAEKQIEMLKTELELLKSVNKEARNYADVFPEAESDANGFFTEGVLTNLKDWKKNYDKYIQGDISKESLQGYANDLQHNVRIMADAISRQLRNVKDPTMREALYEVLRNSWIAAQDLDPFSGDYLKLSLDKAIGMSYHSDVLDKIAAESGDKLAKGIRRQIQTGQPLTEAMEKEAEGVFRKTAEKMEETYPEFSSAIQEMLSRNDFYLNVFLRIHPSDGLNELQENISKNSGFIALDNENQERILSWLKENSVSGAFSAAKKYIDEQKKEYEDAQKSLGKTITAAQLAEKKKKYEDAVADAKFIGLDYTGKDKNVAKNKSQKDAVLQSWKDRESVLSRLISLYKKYLEYKSKDEAKEMINGDAQSTIIKDLPVDDEAEAYKTLHEAAKRLATTEERRQERDRLYAKWKEAEAQKEIDNAKEKIQLDKEEIENLKSRWSVYRKFYQSTGDKTLASLAGFGNTSKFGGNLVEELEAKINELTDGRLEDTMKSSEKELDETYGKNSQVKILVEALKNARKEQFEKTQEEFNDIIKESLTSEGRKGLLQEKVDKITEWLEKLAKSNPEESGRIKGYKDAVSQYNTEQGAKIDFEDLKKSSEWQMLFESTENLAEQTLRAILTKLENATFPGLGATETKELTNSINKAREALGERAPYERYSFLTQRAAFAKDMLGRENDGKVQITDQDNQEILKKYGLKPGSYDKNMFLNWEKQGQSALPKYLEVLTDRFKAFESVLQPVIDLFSALGDETLGDVAGIGGKAFGAAASVGGGLNTMAGFFKDGSGMNKFLGKLAPYGAAAGMALSVASSLIALHDKAIQKEIDASKQRQKEAENMFKNLKDAMTNTLGGIFSNNSYESMKNQLVRERDEIAKQLGLERKKKRQDDSVISDLLQQLHEANEAVEDFSKEMAKELYSIDFKSYAQNLASAIVGAWASGKDAVVAYGDAVRDIMKSVLTNVAQQSIVERMLSGLEKQLVDYLDKNEMIWDDGARDILAQMYDKASTAAGMVEDMMDDAEYLANKFGHTLKDSNTGTMANGIQSITENTAGILTSYINGIRANTSVLQLTNTDILKTLTAYSNTMPAIQQSQLEQLRIIAVNTQRSADNAEQIYGLLNKVTNGTLQLSVR